MALISGWIFILLLQNLPGSGVKPPGVNPYHHRPSMGLWSSSRHWGGVGIVATQFFECSIKQKVCVKSGTLRIRLQETTFSPKKIYGSSIYWGAPQGRFLSLDCWTSAVKNGMGLAHCPFLRNGSVSLKHLLPRQFPLLAFFRLWEFPNLLKSIPSLLCMPW